MALDLMKKPILHPILFALFPVVFLYAHNADEVDFTEILLPAGLVLVFTLAAYLVLRNLVKDKKKSGAVVSLFLVISFSFEHLFPYLPGWKIANMIGFKYVYLGWWVLFIAGAYYFVKTRKDLSKLTVFFNVVSAALVVISLTNIGAYKLKKIFQGSEVENLPSAKPVSLEADLKDKPDIYYIVLDRYAREDVLREVYDFDDSDFTGYLKDKGFYVAGESYANYLITPQAMASTLNMEYINYLSESVGEDSTDRAPFHKRIEDNRVWRLLKSEGYQFIYIGNGAQPLSRNRYADENFNLYPVSEFSLMLYRTTIFHPITNQLGILDERKIRWERILYQFDKLEEIPSMKGQKFVYAHILAPHDPFVFGDSGEFLPKDVVKNRSKRENYLNQLMFVNKRTKQLVDKLLSDATNPPVIILQSDEGPYPLRFAWLNGESDWRKASSLELQEKMGILNAFNLPGVEESGLYPSISPVNSFRLVFNLYFGADLEILSDEHYIFEDRDHLYKFTNVNEKVRGEVGE